MAAPARASTLNMNGPQRRKEDEEKQGMWEALNDFVERPETEMQRRARKSGPRRRIPKTGLELERDLQLQAQEAAEQLRMEQSVAMEEAAEKKAADRGNKQLVVQTFLAQLGMLYGMTQGSLLLLFVPTQCPRREPGTTTLFTYRHSLPPGHVCTMQETVDFDLRTPWGNAVLLMNFVTLVGLLFSQVYFWKRELYFINHLEEDQSKPYAALPKQLEGYEDLKEDVNAFNEGAFRLAVGVTLSVTANFIMVCVILFTKDESGTTLRLICNVLLILPRVYGYLVYGRTSRENQWAISFFTVIPSSFNLIDEQYKKNDLKPDSEPNPEEDIAE